MRVLLKKTDDSLCCMELTKVTYDPESQELSLENMEEVVVISDIDETNARYFTMELYRSGLANLTSYRSDC